jgi:hypothetical protein
MQGGPEADRGGDDLGSRAERRRRVFINDRNI